MHSLDLQAQPPQGFRAVLVCPSCAHLVLRAMSSVIRPKVTTPMAPFMLCSTLQLLVWGSAEGSVTWLESMPGIHAES